jgi:hypothetical protein
MGKASRRKWARRSLWPAKKQANLVKANTYLGRLFRKLLWLTP